MNEDHIEQELQFDAPDLEAVDAWVRAQPAHASIVIASMGEKQQRDTYLDTADWAFCRARYTLRIRRLEGGGSEATLKAFGKRDAGPRQRREINQRLEDSDETIGATAELASGWR